MFFVPLHIRNHGIDVVKQQPTNSSDRPPLDTILRGMKPHDRDSRTAKSKAKVAKESATTGPKGVVLIIDVFPPHGGKAAAYLERTPSKAHLVEKVLAKISQCNTFN
mmetsp:Transcript_33411/g.38715  ORF Transcript_33411/g.38715 Transcript_33411/m.38715 type:complete len:107 (+) Transcript_33411:515-835(+)